MKQFVFKLVADKYLMYNIKPDIYPEIVLDIQIGFIIRTNVKIEITIGLIVAFGFRVS